MQKYRFFIIQIILLFLFCLLLAFSFYRHPSFLLYSDDQVLRKAYETQIDWFLNNQTVDGAFPYRINTFDGTIVQESASESAGIAVRTLSALHTLSLINSQKMDPKINNVIKKGIDYYKKYLVRKEIVLNEKNVYVQHLDFQDPLNTTNSTSVFFLLSVIEYLKTNPPNKLEYEILANELGMYLLTTQLPSGGFAFTPTIIKENDYHNAQSFYALVTLGSYTNNPEILIAAEKTAGYFLNKYSEFNKGFFSWGMRGFYQMYALSPKNEYVTFMREQTDQYLADEGKAAENYFKEGTVPLPAFDTIVYTEGVLETARLFMDLEDTIYALKLKQFA